SLQNFQPSDETKQVVSQQANVLAQAGPEGKAVLHDINVFCQGINDYFSSVGSSQPPFTPTDIFALNALKDQFVGEGGGDEARRSEFLGALQPRRGARRGYRLVDDSRQHLSKGRATTVAGTPTCEDEPPKS